MHILRKIWAKPNRNPTVTQPSFGVFQQTAKVDSLRWAVRFDSLHSIDETEEKIKPSTGKQDEANKQIERGN